MWKLKFNPSENCETPWLQIGDVAGSSLARAKGAFSRFVTQKDPRSSDRGSRFQIVEDSKQQRAALSFFTGTEPSQDAVVLQRAGITDRLAASGDVTQKSPHNLTTSRLGK